MMESLEKLRDENYIPGYRGNKTLEMIADAIQAEVDERFMPLPLDADGVPIRVGEIVESDIFGLIEVDGFVHGAVAFWSYDPQPARIATCPSGLCCHVKPRTVEDVLREFAYKVCDLNVSDDAIAKYAAELQMKDGAE